MTKPKTVTSQRQTRGAELARRDLCEVRGGTGGTIIVEDLLPGGAQPRGIQGSGHG